MGSTPRNRVRELRAQADLAQEDLAQMAGLRVGTISRIENGRVHPHARTMMRISRALGKPVDLVFPEDWSTYQEASA